jgi:hypothetical protein
LREKNKGLTNFVRKNKFLIFGYNKKITLDAELYDLLIFMNSEEFKIWGLLAEDSVIGYLKLDEIKYCLNFLYKTKGQPVPTNKMPIN